MSKLETQRLILRPFEAADAPCLAELANHREIADMLSRLPHPYTLVHAQEFIADCQTPAAGQARFAITLRDESNTLVGSVGYGPDKSPDETNFGYWFGLDHWGKGYATEAGLAAVAHAFEVSKVAKLDTDFFPSNPASGRVLEKLGFESQGERQCHSLATGETDTSIHMRLTTERHAEFHGGAS